MEHLELKKYQLAVLSDLDMYIEELESQPTIKKAFSSYWQRKGIPIDSVKNDYIRPYNDEIQGVPNITIKVPTAGGKTYIACRALKHIFQTHNDEKPKVVVWFVPSDPILKQTYKNLRNPDHPYRHAIDVDFGGKVQVVNKEAALVGENIRPAQIAENLTIFVLSVQSFASNSKDDRRSRRDNEFLAEHVSTYTFKDKLLRNADETSLLQVISQLNPVVIIDESHNFEKSEMRIDLKKEINPSFIFNLTATPRKNSNIISFVDAMQLKLEHMVKLPVIVYNHKTTTEVIQNAITLQRSLEQKAIEQSEKFKSKYIRPIVLFQAQPKTNNDNITFEKIKEKLIEAGIPEAYVKIKTAEIDEIKNMDLMSETCDVRFIITVNALKEGWDCSFAYILASLANKSSKIDVEQILGRVLRLPYTKEQKSDLLNLSYVFTCSADFQSTLKHIIDSLNNAGFSKRDCRLADENQSNDDALNIPDEGLGLFSQQKSLFESPKEEMSDIDEESETDISEEINIESIKETIESKGTDEVIDQLETSALQQSSEYNENLSNIENDTDSVNTTSSDMNSTYIIKPIFSEQADLIKLPIFVQKAESMGLFGEGKEYVPLEKSDLSEGIDLSVEDHKIDFTRSVAEVVQVDLASDNSDGTDSVPIHKRLNMQQLDYIKKQLLTIPPEGKKHQLAGALAKRLNFAEISEIMLTEYIYDCIKNLNNEEIDDLVAFQLDTIQTFKNKINSILDHYRYDTFAKWLDLGKIKCIGDKVYSLPKQIMVTDKMVGVPKGLFKEEENVNGFEYDVISAIANEDNVLFWHRNQERGKGFFINGFINHYPDFIVRLKSGQTLLIETKGGDRDNSDSQLKLELGTTWANWANKVGQDSRYYMVFEKEAMKGAITLKELLGKINQLSKV